MNNKDRIKYTMKWIPAIFILCCSWYLSSRPTIEHMPTFLFADKIVHAICFGGLSFWITFAIQSKKIASIPLTSLYGIIDEYHQSFVPGRSCSFYDWIADFTGAILGFMIFLLICFLYKKTMGKY